MKRLMFTAAVTAFSISTADAAPLYDCHGDAACQAKRSRVSEPSYERNINACLASVGATRAQWRAHSVPEPAAGKVRACLVARNG